MSIRSLTHLHSLLLYHHITIAPAIILWLPTACHDQLHSLYSAVHILSSAPTSISPSPSLSRSLSPPVSTKCWCTPAKEGRCREHTSCILSPSVAWSSSSFSSSQEELQPLEKGTGREAGRNRAEESSHQPSTINQRMNLNLQCVPNNNNNIWFMYVASSAVGRVLKWMLAGCVWLALLPWADVYSSGKRVCQKLHPLPWFTATQQPRNRHKHRLQEIISVRWSSAYYTGKERQQGVTKHQEKRGGDRHGSFCN